MYICDLAGQHFFGTILCIKCFKKLLRGPGVSSLTANENNCQSCKTHVASVFISERLRSCRSARSPEQNHLFNCVTRTNSVFRDMLNPRNLAGDFMANDSGVSFPRLFCHGALRTWGGAFAVECQRDPWPSASQAPRAHFGPHHSPP